MATDTKARLLDAAEKLFSDLGIRATSLRSITSAAGANLAAVNYHFGSKEGLVRAVLERRLGPLGEERLRMLEEVDRNDPAEVRLEAIIRALVIPFLRLLEASERRNDDFPRFLGRTHFEADTTRHEVFLEFFRPTVVRFLELAGDCLPDLSAREIFARFTFVIGSLAASINMRMFAGFGEAMGVSALNAPTDIQNLADQLVPFLCAGFRAPPCVVRTSLSS